MVDPTRSPCLPGLGTYSHTITMRSQAARDRFRSTLKGSCAKPVRPDTCAASTGRIRCVPQPGGLDDTHSAKC